MYNSAVGMEFLTVCMLELHHSVWGDVLGAPPKTAT